jgi:hypothetical protein
VNGRVVRVRDEQVLRVVVREARQRPATGGIFLDREPTSTRTLAQSEATGRSFQRPVAAGIRFLQFFTTPPWP